MAFYVLIPAFQITHPLTSKARRIERRYFRLDQIQNGGISKNFKWPYHFGNGSQRSRRENTCNSTPTENKVFAKLWALSRKNGYLWKLWCGRSSRNIILNRSRARHQDWSSWTLWGGNKAINVIIVRRTLSAKGYAEHHPEGVVTWALVWNWIDILFCNTNIGLMVLQIESPTSLSYGVMCHCIRLQVAHTVTERNAVMLLREYELARRLKFWCAGVTVDISFPTGVS